MDSQHVDVLIIGAGLSGVGAACHLTRKAPQHSYLVLERRARIGGTWDLFRYPGIRSDSDMYTLGYKFRPWRGTKVLADGPSIRAYVEETADEYGITPNIRFHQKVVDANWSSEDELWTVHAVDETSGEVATFTSRFLMGSTGYYNYDAGYRPDFPGEERFGGPIVHPQQWPEDLEYAGKRVVVIGSGATAITLVPEMAKTAAHVTMLQRSPTYILAVPEVDPMAELLSRLHVPGALTYRLGRIRNIALQRGVYDLSRKAPWLARRLMLRAVEAQVGSAIDLKHFMPTYNPWDERLCVVPRGDLFRALRRGSASIVTDHIETFTETGIKLTSGQELEADIVVVATGLQVQLMGGVHVEVDGVPVDVRDKVIYKGVMIDGIPNAMFILGYTNASWTLKADLASEYFCRLLNHMDRKGHTRVVATAHPDDRSDESAMGSALKSGYIRRADSVMPRQGTRKPWKVLDNYYRDAIALRHGAIADSTLQFSDEPVAAPTMRPRDKQAG